MQSAPSGRPAPLAPDELAERNRASAVADGWGATCRRLAVDFIVTRQAVSMVALTSFVMTHGVDGLMAIVSEVATSTRR